MDPHGRKGVNFAYRQTAPAKPIGIAMLVVLLHALSIYGLASRQARWKVVQPSRPVEVRLIEEPPPAPQPAPPPPTPAPPVQPTPAPRPPAAKPRRPAPAPEAKVRKPAPVPSMPAPATSVAPPPSTPPVPSGPPPAAEPAPAPPAPAPTVKAAPAPHVPVRTAPAVEGRYCALPEYPSASRQFEETGTVVLSFLIDVDGRVLQGRVEASSGYRRLDEAALRALSLCRFRPGTVDGKPEKSWHRLKYVWKLEE